MPRAVNPIWDYYEACEDKKAKCNFCGAILSYVSTTNNLKTHLKRIHGFTNSHFARDSETVNGNNTEVIETPIIPKKRKNASYLWKLYKIIDTYIASCRLCNQNVRFKGSTANLAKHLKRYHEDAVQTIKATASYENTGDTGFDSDEDPILQQDVYFEEENDQVKCTICGKVISEDGQDPRDHLEEHHPGLLARIIKNEDRAEEETGDEEEEKEKSEKDIFTEVVYLDEVSTPPPTKKRKSQTIHQTIEKKQRKLSTDSDDYVLKSKKTTEIDTFTTYIKILLEKLPQDVCSRVQLEIISLIMAAQFKPSNTVSRGTTTSVSTDNNDQDN